MFKSMYDKHDRVYANAGSRERVLYKPVVNEDGVLDLVADGVENIYDYIQSHKESCDVNCLLRRFAAGETDVLSRVQGVYMDVTQMPRTYAELLQTVIDGERYFDTLPVDVRAKFNHSFREWMAAMDNMPAWLSAMGYEQPKEIVKTDKSVEEVAPNES